jgi:haloacetate dehalogenase
MTARSALHTLLPGFSDQRIVVADRTGAPGQTLSIPVLSAGSGPPLLLLHGHPQTRALWHRVAPRLAAHFTVVLTDLRGYGDADKPATLPDHTQQSFRAMAADQVEVMRALGFGRFRILAHDRGARTAHRMALDHPECVERMSLLDIAPTLTMYGGTDREFATRYWHWFFLIQPAPLPERFINADPDAYILATMGGRHAGIEVFDPLALAEYRRCLGDPATVHALCEDYRAAASVDLEHDRSDRAAGRMVQCPVQVLWGQFGAVEACFEPLAAWREVALDVVGQTLPCGHYIPEEAPDALLDAALPFLL